MKVEVSIGEAIDKLSILEIKLKKILDEAKKIEIQKEIDCLQECENYKISYYFYYSLLMYVNKKIWDMTDIIKSITPEDSQFSQISNNIFEFNQKRFRIKNWFNLLTDSNIKEQKSYALSHCKIVVENEEIFFKKLSEIHFLTLEYDVITFESSVVSIISACLKTPTIIYDNEQKNLLNEPTVVVLSNFSIPDNVDKKIFTIENVN